ncbi:MAG: glycosyltransferase family 4 protein, partial [Actinomycetota bacterium]|nr:glycosyltransferase family 4 protein [Actinomycetota bacterium]
MKVAFVSQPWAGVLPASESVSIWNEEVARLLAGDMEVAVYATATTLPVGRHTHSGVEYRIVSATPDWRMLKLLERLPKRHPRRPLFAWRSYFPTYAWRVGADLRRQGCDVVHVHNFSQFVPILRRLLPQATIVLHMHCEWLSTLSPRMVEPRLRQADLVIGCSEHITEGVRRRFPAHAARCRTVPEGVDVDAFSPDPHRPAQEPPRLLSVGRISPEKGFHVLLEAVARLRKRGVQAELECVGPDSPVPHEMLVGLYDDPGVQGLARFYDRPYLETAFAAAGPEVRSGVTLRGALPYAEVADCYRSADVFVQPSIADAFPLPCVEVMAAGLPVVASATGGIVEAVRDG